MRGRFTTVVVLVAAVMFVAADAHAPVPAKDPGGLTVHEWGTFTSIAGVDGEAVGWSPLTGADDLPCFVDRVQFGPKWSLWGTVRMETPVLYFYSTADMTVNVNVRFRQGVITEWFPQARVTPAMIAGIPAERAIELRKTEGSASWTNVRIRPRAAADFPRESRPQPLLSRARDRRGAGAGRLGAGAVSVLPRCRRLRATDERDRGRGRADRGEVARRSCRRHRRVRQPRRHRSLPRTERHHQRGDDRPGFARGASHWRR